MWHKERTAALLMAQVIIFSVFGTGMSARAGSTVPLAGCSPDWTVVASPNNGTLLSYLRGASALSESDAWAVGHYRNPSFRELTLTEHWNGSAWSIIPSPNVANDMNYFYDVDASGSTDAWAVGEHHTGVYTPLIERWNGTAWSIKTSPSFTGNSWLNGVASLATDNAWAVGFRFTTFPETLIEHWNGTAWSVTPSPNPTSNNELTAISALSSSDIWAVGTKVTDSQRPLTLRWDGTAWNEVPSPDSGMQTLIYGVVAISATDAWAVGASNAVAYTQHWDGTNWTAVPAPFGSGSSLSAVTATSTGDVWATGTAYNGSILLTLVAHWNGTAWSQVASPSPSTHGNQLLAADSADGRIWAVGTQSPDGSELDTLVETACPNTLTLTGFSPPAGTVGSGVTITGTGFTDVSSVTFNGVAATTFMVDSSTEIRAKVPMGATTGPIAVTTSQGTVQSQTAFVVKPKINTFKPRSGPVGTLVTIEGSAFDGTTSVTFNGVQASYSVRSYSKIRATVPAGATTGRIAVTTPDGRTRSGTDFIVT